MEEESKKAVLQLVAGVVGILLLIQGWNLVSPIFNPPHIEVSGTVKYEDCREKIMLTGSESKKQTGTFVCDLSKTNSGKVLNGRCIKTVIDTSGQCQTAYIYEKPSEITCGDNSYPNIDDQCTCNFGYVSYENQCILFDQMCKKEYGPNSYADYKLVPAEYGGYRKSFEQACYCSKGYIWNQNGTECVVSYEF